MLEQFAIADGPRQCASNMRNVVLAVLGYLNDTRRERLPSGTWPNPSLPPEHRLSWYAAILPYLDKPELLDPLDKSQPWDGAVNDQVAYTRIGVIEMSQCRTAFTSGGLVTTPYIGIAGWGSMPLSCQRATPGLASSATTVGPSSQTSRTGPHTQWWSPNQVG